MVNEDPTALAPGAHLGTPGIVPGTSNFFENWWQSLAPNIGITPGPAPYGAKMPAAKQEQTNKAIGKAEEAVQAQADRVTSFLGVPTSQWKEYGVYGALFILFVVGVVGLLGAAGIQTPVPNVLKK